VKYTVVIEKPAAKFISHLAQPEKERVLKAINELPHKGDIKRLQGKKSRGMYRLRVGSYRIIYTVDNGQLVVCVVDAGNRGQIYNRY
jgi:mRNA interferase RelE/StbE